MTNDFVGNVIRESLADPSILDRYSVLRSRVEPVTDYHRTPWLTQWTIQEVSIPADAIEETAEQFRQALDANHPEAWYVDFKNDTTHFVIFVDRVFRIHRGDESQYVAAVEYGLELGIPERQLDFGQSF